MSDAPFEICGPLPTGVTVLEASAGTGKTFTIAALATRYVAEEALPLEQLLLITFTRMATGELRHRVRERMVSAEVGLTRVLGGGATDPSDELLVHLADATDDEVRARRNRLRTALANFEAATIDTTHAFCQRVLTGLGVSGDADRDATFVEDSRDLIEEVVADFYVRKFGRSQEAPAFSVDVARRIARQVVANPDAAIHTAETGPEPDARRSFAERVRDEVARRRRLAGEVTFDDLLTRLRDTLVDPVRGDVAVGRLRARYRVALVDEFQDTDPIQWQILQRAFVDDGASSTLVLIGDPKQAIYAFRGADVYSYLRAAAVAGQRATLATNWRSDQALLDAYDAVFDEATLGHSGIAYRKVEAAVGGSARRLVGDAVGAPLRFRMVHREDGLAPLTAKTKELQTDPARAVIAADVAADVVRLLSSKATIDADSVRPGHIAVLVQRNADALRVRDALDDVGVPAVVNSAGSVFETAAARDWWRLLQALERPSSVTPVRAVALTSFFGWTATEVASATDLEWETVHAQLHRWAGVMRRRGVAALFELASRRGALAARLLSRSGGERLLTDLRHVVQLLHEAATADQLGVNALVAWLHTRMEEADDEVAPEDRTRRLESDAEAVQVLTVFRSKGLEFPVVYCPYLWSPGPINDKDPPVFHDASADDRRTVDVSGDRDSPAKRARLVEARGEELRLLYVALTRAKHQAVVWWAATGVGAHSSLCRLLFCREADGSVPTLGKLPTDADASARLAELAASAPAGCIAVERVTAAAGGVRWAGDGTAAVVAPASLAVATFGRTLDPTWRRTSYSALTEAAHDVAPVAPVGSEAEEPAVTDEEAVEVVPAASGGGTDPLLALEVPLGVMRAGADVGTFVHGVFERCDFAADDLDASLVEALAAESARGAVDLGDRDAVLGGLRSAIETPLGPIVGGISLRDIGRRDRVDELSFELPLVGGDAPTSVLTVAAIGAVLSKHVPADDPMAAYAAHLDDPVLQSEIRGYLTGSIDLVLRTPDGRYAVVDYKTNRLAPRGEPLTAWHYRPEAVLDAMFRSHYPLQALLYTVALHRYLRWRLAGYSAEAHLAGILYAFVRGMVGPATPVVDGHSCGVFSWRPPAALIEALSDLFDRGAEVAA